MQGISSLILVATPDEVAQAQTFGLPMGHVAYRIGGGAHLFRSNTPTPAHGGVMVIDDTAFDGRGSADGFCQEVLRECTMRHFTGIICDFDQVSPLRQRIISQLAAQLARQTITLYVSEAYGTLTTDAKVLISTALSGGTLRQRLEDVIAQYGAHRVVLSVEPVAEDFFLPTPSGQGLALTQDALEARIQGLRPSIFFSSELCAQYFTYMTRENRVHFILFDNANSIRKKLELGHNLGIQQALLPYAALKDWLPDILH